MLPAIRESNKFRYHELISDPSDPSTMDEAAAATSISEDALAKYLHQVYQKGKLHAIK
jgi:hypothetical protein